jgi:hypothetical protein
MGLSEEMKNLSEEILTSFKNRIKENEELVTEVQKTLDGFQKDHQEMADTLKTDATALKVKLDKDEKNRLKESDILMKKIAKDHKDMATAVRANLDKGENNRLNEFDALRKSINEKISEIFTFTHDLLAKSEVERRNEFDTLIKSINEEISEIFTSTHDLLATGEFERRNDFHALMKDINEEILRIFTYTRNMLSNGETERLNEFNIVMNGVCNDVKNLKKAVAGLLGNFAQDRNEARVVWGKMSNILTQLRKTALSSPTKIEKEVDTKGAKKTTTAEIGKDVPTEVLEEMSIKVDPRMESEPAMALTLEEKVLDFINKRPSGVRISEMEEPLGETRMKLGFIAKNLLDVGQVQKIENFYFPLK